MDKNKIETLLMEQALHELSTDAEDLLEAYLSDHPEFMETAESIRRTAELGQKAVSFPLPSDLPPFPREKMLRAIQRSCWKRAGRWGFSVAASILIGIGIGVFSARQPRISEPPERFAQSAPVNTSGLDSARAFWSAQTYMDRYQKSRTKRTESKTDTILQKRIQNLKKGGTL